MIIYINALSWLCMFMVCNVCGGATILNGFICATTIHNFLSCIIHLFYQGKGTMVTWWLLGKERFSSCSSLLHPSPPVDNRKHPSSAVSDIVSSSHACIGSGKHPSSAVLRTSDNVSRGHDRIPSGRCKLTYEEMKVQNEKELDLQLPGSAVYMVEQH